MPERITEKLVRNLELPANGNRRIYDTELTGFGIRATATGAKSFVLNYYLHGRERRITIGSYPEWSVQAARRQAGDLKRRVDQGDDPLEERNERRAAPTVRDLFRRYSAEHLPRKALRSAADDRSMWKAYILPALAALKVADISHSDCDALHRQISLSHPIRANRVIEVLRKALNLAIRWTWRDDNPASGVNRNPQEKRQRYLSQSEMGRAWQALEAHPERTSATAIQLMALTGCRRSEALMARWEEFDFERRIWTRPSAHTKQRKLHRAPLPSAAANLLCMWRSSSAGVYVFPGKADRPLTDVKRTWNRVRTIAGLENVRLHDLRHTYASILASEGKSLLVIGQMLGHTQTQTTARYSHLMDDPLRDAAEIVGAFITFQG